MKLSGGFLLSSLSCAVVAASRAGHVFVYDPFPKTAPQQSPSLTPETARLVLAQRLGVSRFHSVESDDEDLIDQLNTYGGRQELFQGQNVLDRSYAHTLVWIEDVEDMQAIIKEPSAYSADFAISSPPPTSDNDRLIEDLISQAESLPRKSDPQALTYTVGISTEASFQPVKKANTYNDFLTVFRADKTSKGSFAEISQILHDLVEKSTRSHEKGWAMTVVLMPPSASQSKRSAQPYGTYRMPSSAEARRQNPEAFLSPGASEPSSTPQTPNVSDLEDFPVFQQDSDSKAPLGILPICFDTMDKCVSRTNNCTAHGECKLLHPGKQGLSKDCYGCACKPTIVHVGEDKGMETHRKVTYWGGPACQKKDVSQPFWLFVGTGVVLAGLIAGGIGLLYSMGSEELPSVIGAGVSGPVRK